MRAKLPRCVAWQCVGMHAFGGWDGVDLDEVLLLQRQVARWRHWPLLLQPRLRPGFAGRLERYGR